MVSAILDPQRQSFDMTALLADAMAWHQAGRLADAERAYNQILAVDPENCDCLHLLGVILRQRGKPAQAVVQIDLSLAKNPNNAAAWNNRGTALYELERLDEAVASYDRALAIVPGFAFALSNRGAALYALKRFDEALTSYDRALAVAPDYVEALSNRGNALKELKRFDEALISYDRAVALKPEYAEGHLNRGVVLQELERLDEALASSDRALAIRPDFVEALSNRGSVLYRLKRFEEALASCDRALALQPQFAEAHANRANALQALKRFDEVLVSCDRAVALRPDLAKVRYNRGNALHMMGMFEDALASYDQELARYPDFGEALVNRGASLESLKRFEDALASYQRAYAERPDFADAHYNEALCRLLIGDFRRGWEKYEWRWQTKQLEHDKRNFPQRLWAGPQDIAGQTVLLHAEQGFGDTIQFCRYAPLVAACGARVIFEVPPALYELMSALRGMSQVVCSGSPLPRFDVHCPLLSLPRALGTELATIPSATPYLHASEEKAKQWKARLGPRTGPRTRPRMGIAWSGRPTHKNDHHRSIGLDAFLSIFAGVDVSLVSLQREVRDADAAVLRERGDVLHFGDELTNFADTAALMSALDLIVSVDTSVAHLAGALAKPVWVLLPFIPDWRWLLDRNESPWYPTARLFRQDATRAWDNVFARVRGALRAGGTLAGLLAQ